MTIACLSKGLAGLRSCVNTPASFSSAASDVLASVQLKGSDGLRMLGDFILNCPRMPTQADPYNGFGEPPITVMRAGDVSLEAIYWRTGNTAIHQHSFSGAFTVVAGRSIHCTYRFQPGEIVEARRLLLGDLTLTHAELLRPGDVRRILPGDGLIHSVVHVGQPTVSLVIRRPAPTGEPQYGYLRPNVAIDFASSTILAKRCEMLHTLGTSVKVCEDLVYALDKRFTVYERVRLLLALAGALSRARLTRLHASLILPRCSPKVGRALLKMLLWQQEDVRQWRQALNTPGRLERQRRVIDVVVRDGNKAKRGRLLAFRSTHP